ncbi:MAG: methylmalonyl-CoA carboxyltransferase [Acidimicrobiales bacterium]|nr:methylmalonyl-CoA carboxyltransferase [Acidimicrobiales bacterium]
MAPSPAAASAASSMPVALRARTAGKAKLVVTELEGRPCVLVTISREPDPDLGAGPASTALSPSDGETVAAAADEAFARRLPLVLFVSTNGINPADGAGALHGWGQAARAMVRNSGIVPFIAVTTGPLTAGLSLVLGLADIVVMTQDSYSFVSGPRMVEQFTGIGTDRHDLGGAGVHERISGVASLVVADEAEATNTVGELLSLLPSHTDELAPLSATTDRIDRSTPGAYAVLPDTPTGSYDVRDIITTVVDDDYLLELRPTWAANLVTAFSTVGGRPVGIVANQPQTVAGTLDIAASQKGARFVAMCDAFNLPLVTFVDTSGFYPGKDLEWRGMIRYGAQLAFAYARATVPRVNITLRKSYGGAYIVMDSKHMGNDVALAWPSAEIAVMGAKGAVEILHRRASAEERAELEIAYEDRLLNPYVAAERGSIEQVIDPASTRREVGAALEMLATKRERLPRRRHDNSPL